MNMFAYTRNNPLKYVDPDGKELRLADNQTASDATAIAAVLARAYQKANLRGYINNIVASPVKNTVGKVAISDETTYAQNVLHVPLKKGTKDVDTSDRSKVKNDIQVDIDKANVTGRDARDVDKFVKHELYHANEINTDINQAIADHKSGADDTKATKFEDEADDPDTMTFDEALRVIDKILGISQDHNECTEKQEERERPHN